MTAFPSTPIDRVLYAVRISLFLELAIFAFRWVSATNKELDLWVQWMRHPRTKARRDSKGAIFALSIFLGIMLALSHDLLYASGYFTISMILNYWTQSLANNHFREALIHTRSKLHEDRPRDARVLAIFEHYWVVLPQLRRISIMALVSFVAFGFAVAARRSPAHSRAYEISGYAILILTILFGEVVIQVWRNKRDSAVEAAEAIQASTQHA